MFELFKIGLQHFCEPVFVSADQTFQVHPENHQAVLETFVYQSSVIHLLLVK